MCCFDRLRSLSANSYEMVSRIVVVVKFRLLTSSWDERTKSISPPLGRNGKSTFNLSIYMYIGNYKT